nr:3-hydroxyacyl-CoA dehydrogenase/enoyl-CoA hydratase family protein [Rubeoparvulum massiliense]
MRAIRRVVVIGSGVMGSGIAAHLANAGLIVDLLDIVPQSLTAKEEQAGLTLEDPRVRNRLAEEARQRLLQTKPAPLFTPAHLKRIEAGNLEDHHERLQQADWIIEVVVEKLEVKQVIFQLVDEWRKPGSIVSSNTSGISIAAMAAGRSDDFRHHFCGTHFFNPPRYLKLLEVIPTEETKPEVVQFIRQFAEQRLGKGVVIARDTVNFIANRIGTYGLQVTIQAMVEGGYGIDEVDEVTGPLLGRPKSATFRTLDVVGLDTYAHVANNVHLHVEDEAEKQVFCLPTFVQTMISNGWLGAKTGQGFYQKTRGQAGKEILVLNVESMEYRPRQRMQAPSINRAKQAKTLEEKIRILAYSEDRAGKLVWEVLKSTLLYAASKVGEIAEDLHSIDQAMRWGFGWELGPFEVWDALGVVKSVERMQAEGEVIPTLVKELLASGQTSFYQRNIGTTHFFTKGAGLREIEHDQRVINLEALKEKGRVITRNAGATLLDLDDGIALLQFTSPNNALGLDVIQLIHQELPKLEERYRGLVIGNQGKHFCVGANIALMLMEAQDENWFELEQVIKGFQQAMMKLKYSKIPVVAAPFQMALGGGAEISFPAAHIQAAAETYLGLVEVGVGLIPGGGGNKEVLLRLLDTIPEGVEVDLQSYVNQAFMLIAMARVSTSAHEAKALGLLRPQDGVTMNQDFLLYDAKQKAIRLAEEGYAPPIPRKIPVVGETGLATLELGAYGFLQSGQISDHDYTIAKKLAFVLAGGHVPKGTLVDEEYLLDLEREAFLSLLGEVKTQQRMQHMLLKGKPLRN